MNKPDKKILLFPYTQEWKLAFEALKSYLGSRLAAFDIDIQHVGSTAIPGMVAKPILDIDLIVGNKGQLPHIVSTLEGLGYVNKGELGISGRYAFRQSSMLTPGSTQAMPWFKHHLYVCFKDCLALKNHLLFRNALLVNSDIANDYAQLKKSIANSKGITRERYTKQKTEFIISVLAQLGLNANELKQIELENR